jgi:hypothetical protein
VELFGWLGCLGAATLGAVVAVVVLVGWLTGGSRSVPAPRQPPVTRWVPDDDDRRLEDLDPQWVREELDAVDQNLILGPE